MLKYHKKETNLSKTALHKVSAIRESLVFLLLLQHFGQKLNILSHTLQHRYLCKNRKVNHSAYSYFQKKLQWKFYLSNANHQTTLHMTAKILKIHEH